MCNEVCDECTSDIVNMSNDDDNYELINVSSNGSSSDGHLIKKQTIEFLNGIINTVGLMDPNNLFKAVRSQLTLFTSIKTIGVCLFIQVYCYLLNSTKML